MNRNQIKSTPEPTLRRLPRYLHLLKRLKFEGISDVSSMSIGNELEIDSAQVRKDIDFTVAVGKPKTGYNVQNLIDAIESHLNWNNVNEAFLVGAGNLGSAILGYDGFKEYGLNFVAAFDVDKNLIDKEINGVKILHLSKLIELAQRMRVHIGVVTVPANFAQETVNMLIKGGVRAIWNFAPIQLKVPKTIIVENASLNQSLAVLNRKLIESMKAEN